MSIYNDLAIAKDNLRRAKDHEQTMRAIAEWVELNGKNADDRKRELAFLLSQDEGWRKALNDVRDAEELVDAAQAKIDQIEAEQRAREIKLRWDELDATRETNRLRAIDIRNIIQIKGDIDDLFSK